MKAGDAFYIRDRDVDTHLWVIISEPDRDPERGVSRSMQIKYKFVEILLDQGVIE